MKIKKGTYVIDARSGKTIKILRVMRSLPNNYSEVFSYNYGVSNGGEVECFTIDNIYLNILGSLEEVILQLGHDVVASGQDYDKFGQIK